MKATTLFLMTALPKVMPGHGMQVGNVNLLSEICDLVIVVGGDGSLLGTARSAF